MDKYNNIILNALEYYDKNNEFFYKFFKLIRFIIITKNTGKRNKIELYDENKNLLIATEYEVIGKYYSGASVWVWAWTDPSLSKYQNSVSKQILVYGIELDPSKDILLKLQLITSKIIITNEIQLDVQLAVSSYISKQKLIFKYRLALRYLTENIYWKQDDIANNEVYLDLHNMFNPQVDKDYMEYYLCLFDYEKIEKLINNQNLDS